MPKMPPKIKPSKTREAHLAALLEEADRRDPGLVANATLAMETERDQNFLNSYRGKMTASDQAAKETKTKLAFHEFFDLAAKLNEIAHSLHIKTAVLDAENGQVNITYQSGTRNQEPQGSTVATA